MKKQKEEQRKAFNFLLSYYDVYKRLPNPQSKEQFITAICEKQFFGIEPDLSGIEEFAYASQKHSLDKSRMGWEDVQKRETITTPSVGPSEGGSVGPSKGPSVQEKEKEKDKETIIKYFDLFWDAYDKKIGRDKCYSIFSKIKPELYETIINQAKQYNKATPDKQFRKHPATWLNGKHWEDEIKTDEPKMIKAFHPIIFD